MTDAIDPFEIQVPDSALLDLNERLARTRWPEAETVADWSQGIPLAYVQELCAYWRKSYDWRVVEARINALPQFVTTIDGVDIHFLHVRSPEDDAKPLVLTHGWPGSIVEFLKVIGPLSNPVAHGGDAADAFHLVIPTIPGYGFSGKPTKTGWGVQRVAHAWAELMARLGYTSYFAQGGDWGAGITVAIGLQDTEHCAGIHTNMPTVGPDRDTLDDLTEQEQDAIKAQQFYQDWDSGYSKQQSTRPQTLGYGLTDSPAGQAAWIVEKFYQWTDCQGHPENVLSRDELLDNVMMYWINACGASSARLYWESFGRGGGGGDITVPSGVSMFPKEIFRASKRWVERRFKDLRHYNTLDRGGHFAAFEQPELFVGELRASFRTMR
ncbi:MAG: epoxide hydrolase [Gammaproteobacteria bacterium]|nr:epoxide hydrolase [Gammaproteobacteria bacterium]MYB39166.1 epoxide hydrolase [Gammaproteobacteria bacterium]